MVVMKFGGSSVANADRIKNISKIIQSKLSDEPVVVSSALKGITDLIIHTAHVASEGKDVSKNLSEIKQRHVETIDDLKLKPEIIDNVLDELFQIIDGIFQNKQLTLEALDEVQGFGERLSVRIIAAYLTSIGIKAQAHDAYDVGMITNSEFGKAEPLPDTEIKLKKALDKRDHIPIITGFIAKDSDQNITTLGRGGSDYTAAIIAAALEVPVEIWTDVNGVMTTDPRIVKEAKTINSITFNEASELAYFGGRVLHPKTILPAIKKNIPVKVLNTFEPENPGTTILKSCKPLDLVTAIATKKEITLISIVSTRMLLAHGFLAKVFQVFENYRKSVDVIATSEVSVTLSVDNDHDIDKITSELEGIAKVEVKKDKAILAIVGEGMHNKPGTCGRMFQALGKANINIEMISQGASEVNITCIINQKDAHKGVQTLHKEFF